MWCVVKLCLVTQSCPTLPHYRRVAFQAPLSMGILQARILEWAVISFSRGSSGLRHQTQVSCIADGFLTVWTTREALLPYYLFLKILFQFCHFVTLKSDLPRSGALSKTMGVWRTSTVVNFGWILKPPGKIKNPDAKKKKKILMPTPHPNQKLNCIRISRDGTQMSVF